MAQWNDPALPTRQRQRQPPAPPGRHGCQLANMREGIDKRLDDHDGRFDEFEERDPEACGRRSCRGCSEERSGTGLGARAGLSGADVMADDPMRQQLEELRGELVAARGAISFLFMLATTLGGDHLRATAAEKIESFSLTPEGADAVDDPVLRGFDRFKRKLVGDIRRHIADQELSKDQSSAPGGK